MPAAAPATPATARSTTFAGLTYDAFDALAAATFWAAALRVEVAPGGGPGHAELHDGGGTGLPKVVFRQVTEGRPLTTPLHLRLATDDVDAEARRLQALGARRLGSVSGDGRRYVVLADPEGNAFELVAA